MTFSECICHFLPGLLAGCTSIQIIRSRQWGEGTRFGPLKVKAKSQHSCLSTHLFPFASPTNHYSIDPSLQTSIKIKTGWHGYSHCFQGTPTGIYHWLLCNDHRNKCQCPSQEHWDWCKPRLQSYSVLSLRILKWMPARLPGFHLENRRVCELHSFCMYKLIDVPMWLCRSLGPENLLLKGATLKNTQKICGESNDWLWLYHSSLY